MQQENSRGGVLRRLTQRMKSSPDGVPSRPTPFDHSRAEVRARLAQTERDLGAADEEREVLKAERLRLQEILGAQHGKRVLPRLKVEKTNGVPSLVAGARMMQRVHAKANDPSAGIDGAGTLFADATRTEAFARSHGLQLAIDLDAEACVVVHAFKGKTPLVELRVGDRVKHVTPGGKDVGDIRPGRRYDPGIQVPAWLDDIVQASQTLSARVSRPYIQIGWTERAGAPVLTGVDVAPVRIPVMNDDWDQRLGKAFDSAHARMLLQPYTAGALDNRGPGGTFHYEETV